MKKSVPWDRVRSYLSGRRDSNTLYHTWKADWTFLWLPDSLHG